MQLIHSPYNDCTKVVALVTITLVVRHKWRTATNTLKFYTLTLLHHPKGSRQ